MADSKQVLMTPPGTWPHVEIILQLGEDAPRTYRLTLRHDSFRYFRWLGFHGSNDDDDAFYLDDMTLSFDK